MSTEITPTLEPNTLGKQESDSGVNKDGMKGLKQEIVGLSLSIDTDEPVETETSSGVVPQIDIDSAKNSRKKKGGPRKEAKRPHTTRVYGAKNQASPYGYAMKTPTSSPQKKNKGYMSSQSHRTMRSQSAQVICGRRGLIENRQSHLETNIEEIPLSLRLHTNPMLLAESIRHQNTLSKFIRTMGPSIDNSLSPFLLDYAKRRDQERNTDPAPHIKLPTSLKRAMKYEHLINLCQKHSEHRQRLNKMNPHIDNKLSPSIQYYRRMRLNRLSRAKKSATESPRKAARAARHRIQKQQKEAAALAAAAAGAATETDFHSNATLKSPEKGKPRRQPKKQPVKLVKKAMRQ